MARPQKQHWHVVGIRLHLPAYIGGRPSCAMSGIAQAYNPIMSIKTAALFALIGTILLTVVLALNFIRDVSALAAGAIAMAAFLVSLIHLLASLSVAVFFFVFYKER
jgi:hypothetical protein